MSDRIRSLIDSIQVTEALDYFASAGWLVADHPNHKLFVMRPSESAPAPVELILPRNRSAVDFGSRLLEAAGVVGRALNADVETILGSIQRVGVDVLRARLLSVYAEHSSLPLDTAQAIVASLKDLVTYAASGESAPLPFFTKPTRIASKHVHQCRFGHTFDGSFGFTVESPLVPQIQESLLSAAQPPFERRVFERIFYGLELAQESVERHQIDPLISHYDTGLNANMCDALVNMREKISDLRVEYAVEWSPKLPMRATGRSRKIDIGPEAFDYLREAARTMRKTEPPQSVVIEGRVVMLRSDSPPWEDEPSSPHTVVVAWLDPEGKLIRTRVVLQPQDYLLACDAHKSGMMISVRGTLERRGKYSRLANPSEFRKGTQMGLFEGGDTRER
jgi:hypothetical protein